MVFSFAPAAVDRPTASPSPAASLSAARLVPAAPTAAPVAAPLPVAAPVLSLPAGITDAQLSAMPDRYVNEPLPASFRVALTIRGIAGVASVDPPAAVIWTEGGLSYLLTSRVRSIPQLVDLASALR